MTDWRPRAAALADSLTQSGALTPDWQRAFAEIPRHVFIPEFYTDEDELVRSDNPAQHERWLAAVYSDVSLTTQLKGAPGTDLLWPTSSSTRPSLMARMLHLLDTADGQRVLEIGTGTGYNAALLSHRLGAAQVTSIDVDPPLVDTARQRLADLGCEPHLYAGDGAQGAPQQAPYDRIIATCGITTIPAAWITQLQPSGVIVADMRGGITSSLIAARKLTAHTVTGRFQARAGHFMWMRPDPEHPLRHRRGFGTTYNFDNPHADTTDIPLAAFDDEDFRFALHLTVPDISAIGTTIRDNQPGLFLITDDDDSWVEISPRTGDRSTVRYGGTRPLWPNIANAWQRWNQQGRPERTRFGFTTHDDGRHTIWLDNPNSQYLGGKTAQREPGYRNPVM